MSQILPWIKLSETDVSPSKWFPIVKRDYQLPNGQIVKDFTVTTVADVAMVVPLTDTKEVVFVRQYKPGADQIMIEFPAGRIEPNHASMEDTALHELTEETGIIAGKLESLGYLSSFPTKGTETIYGFVATDLQFTGVTHFDETENIETLKLKVNEVDQYIAEGKIIAAQTIAFWHILKLRYNTLIGA